VSLPDLSPQLREEFFGSDEEPPNRRITDALGWKKSRFRASYDLLGMTWMCPHCAKPDTVSLRFSIVLAQAWFHCSACSWKRRFDIARAALLLDANGCEPPLPRKSSTDS
jgi:hypothetical protein